MTGGGLFVRTAMALGFLFLYVPIVLLVIYSFNDSRLVTVWGGWTTRWYGALWSNRGLMDAAWNSIVIALGASTIATVLGVMAGFSLARIPRFLGRTLFSGMILAGPRSSPGCRCC